MAMCVCVCNIIGNEKHVCVCVMKPMALNNMACMPIISQPQCVANVWLLTPMAIVMCVWKWLVAVSMAKNSNPNIMPKANGSLNDVKMTGLNERKWLQTNVLCPVCGIISKATMCINHRRENNQ